MVSFDVVSLCTNVPLAETIELVIERLYDNINSNAIPFEKSVFRQVMFVAMQGPFLAKYLDNLITPHIPDTYLLHSMKNFFERLKECPCNNKNTMVSFDVLSLYTNVPLAETIELVIERLYDNNNSNAIPFEKSVFRQLMFVATQGLFMYNNKLCNQIDRVTMGSPLGPTLANFFRRCLEEKIFKNNCNVVPKLYLRYIHDTYALFDNKKDCFKFLDILNSQHSDIKFTIEQFTKANTLSFLDVQG